jgi:hypothetical protein
VHRTNLSVPGKRVSPPATSLPHRWVRDGPSRRSHAWIRETAAVRSAAATTARLTAAPPARMAEDRISAIVDGLGGLIDVLRKADPRDMAELYSRIRLPRVPQLVVTRESGFGV